MIRGRALRAFPRVGLSLALLLASVLVIPTRTIAAPAEGEVSAQMVTTKRMAFDGGVNDYYGMAVAISGDLAVVGAPTDDTPTLVDAGSVYVYVRDGAGWKYDGKLAPLDPSANAYFGTSVSVYNDTILVGADGDATLRGAVYVFTGSGGVWTQQQKIVPAGTGSGAHVGMSVALHQDTALIGAWNESAYVFARSGGVWTQQGAPLTDPDGGPGEMFGNNVALYRDTALVSAIYDDSGRGSVVVFTRTGTTWSRQGRLVASDRAVNDYFGSSVALYRDTAIVGAVGDDDHGDASGAAYLFSRTGPVWTQAQKIAPADGAAGDSFGASASISGEMAIVGATGDDSGAGAVYIVSRMTGTWLYGRMVATDGDGSDHYGNAVAVCGGTMIVGSPFDDDVAGNSGAVYLYLTEPPVAMGLERVAGTNRYLTAVQCSKDAFRAGAVAVVLATGENWPDALGGSALAGAVRGPILLTRKATLPAEVRDEIVRLGAQRVYLLGGTGAISTEVENQLVSLMGRYDVIRLAGATRYQTAELVARAAIAHVGSGWDRHVFVATGVDFPDATAAAPVSAFYVIPVLLADPRSSYVYRPAMALDAYILGGTGAVPATTEAALVASYGAGNVHRYAGANRYATAVLVADAAVAGEMHWSGVGLASGTSFPDALAGGPFLAMYGSPMLLTDPNTLSAATAASLTAHQAAIGGIMYVIGGTSAVSTAVENAAKAAAGMP